LISAKLETSAVSKPHVLMARATSIGLVWLAHQAAQRGWISGVFAYGAFWFLSLFLIVLTSL
jgi:hypothetical protein